MTIVFNPKYVTQAKEYTWKRGFLGFGIGKVTFQCGSCGRYTAQAKATTVFRDGQEVLACPCPCGKLNVFPYPDKPGSVVVIYRS